MIGPLKTFLRRAVIALVLLVTSFYLGYMGIGRSVPVIDRFATTFTTPTELARREFGPSDQLVFVFFAASDCMWCNRPEMPTLVAQALESLENTARSRDLGFVSIGVAMDWEPATAWEFFRGFPHFNQLSLGYGAANLAAVDFFGDRLPAIRATPQIAVLRRTLLGAEDGVALRTRDQRLVLRKIGFYEIDDWVRRGVPIADVFLDAQQASQVTQ